MAIEFIARPKSALFIHAFDPNKPIKEGLNASDLDALVVHDTAFARHDESMNAILRALQAKVPVFVLDHRQGPESVVPGSKPKPIQSQVVGGRKRGKFFAKLAAVGGAALALKRVSKNLSARKDSQQAAVPMSRRRFVKLSLLATGFVLGTGISSLSGFSEVHSNSNASQAALAKAVLDLEGGFGGVTPKRKGKLNIGFLVRPHAAGFHEMLNEPKLSRKELLELLDKKSLATGFTHHQLVKVEQGALVPVPPLEKTRPPSSGKKTSRA